MKKFIWPLWCFAFLGWQAASAQAGEPSLDEVVLTAATLAPVPSPAVDLAETKAGLARLAALGASAPAPSLKEEFASLALKRSPGQPPDLLEASLLYLPHTMALSPASPPPRPCLEVRRERRKMQATLARVLALRASIEASLARKERRCPERKRCRWKQLDSSLEELNARLAELLAYSERVGAEQPDRLVQYEFHLDGGLFPRLSRAGWQVAGPATVTLLKLPRGPALPLPEGAFGREYGFESPPLPIPGGTWRLFRALRPTEACTPAGAFRLEFFEDWQRAQGAPLRQRIKFRAWAL